MIFKYKKINDIVSLAYGFTRHKPKYDLTMTLIKDKNETHIHGLLSKINLKPIDLVKMWRFLVKNVSTKYLVFEVIPEYSKIYKAFLPIEEIRNVKSFNGFFCETLKVRLENRGTSLIHKLKDGLDDKKVSF